MFLGNLSTAAELKARKAQKAAKPKPENPPIKLVSEPTGIPAPKRQSPGSKPIVYVEGGEQIPRDVMLEYLRVCTTMILDTSNIDEIIEDHFRSGNPLYVCAMDFQRDVLEYNFGIEKVFGCKSLSNVPTDFPEDDELISAAGDFIFTAMKSFLKVIEIRAEKLGNPRSTTGGFNKGMIFDFFEACNAKMAMPEVKEELQRIFRATSSPPNARIIEIQRETLNALGYDADYAISFLNNISSDYSEDREMHMKMQGFAMCSQLACKEATMSPEERAQFYEPIPRFMHHFPHMWYMQQQRMNQQKAMNGGGGGGMGGGGGAGASAMLDPVAQIMKTEEGRTKITEMVSKMNNAKASIDAMSAEIETWDNERRTQFFDDFGSHPVVDDLQAAGGTTDPVSRIDKFLSLSESDLLDLLKMQIVMVADMKKGGDIGKRLRDAQIQMWSAAAEAGRKPDGSSNPEAAAKAASEIASRSPLGKIGGAMAVLGSFTNIGAAAMMSMGLGGAGGLGGHGGHGHAPGCSHARGGGGSTVPDVSSGLTEKMDR